MGADVAHKIIDRPEPGGQRMAGGVCHTKPAGTVMGLEATVMAVRL